MALTVNRPELLHDGKDENFRQTIHDALGFSVRLLEIRNGFAESISLTGPAFSILIAIDHLTKQDDIGISHVSEHLHQSGAFVTLEVAKLVKKGLIIKVPNRHDRRRVSLSVTQKATDLLAKLAATQRPVNDAIFSKLDADQCASFADIIKKLLIGTDEGLALLNYFNERRRNQAAE
ncbi:MarR family winged helix-turn-helix transcriptional regulator [Paenochrobactrum sp. BZR 588]|uniref:MarR family winged helix-turn-helix transcriptional regulator n=1 Tax=Paenochrobactrum TaxID=999488 RepID=UPI0035BC71AD